MLSGALQNCFAKIKITVKKAISFFKPIGSLEPVMSLLKIKKLLDLSSMLFVCLMGISDKINIICTQF